MNAERSRRVDHVLILARGASRRLGSPKGLAVAADDRRPLLERVATLYEELGYPVLVVAGPDSADSYRELMREAAGVEILEAEPGGDTARTVGLAWKRLGAACTHLWVHPVDVPGVAPETLRRLACESAARPAEAIRPSHGGRPGHPVIFPAGVLFRCEGNLDGGLRQCETGMRAALSAAGAAVREIGIDDAGTVRDYDTARDLAEPDDLPREPERSGE